ncbi:MAG: DUF4349 domain-containing protein, partial [Chloroflexi bacterium]|nr:DUF4349 domain-containing protein [Chloroflexota bacterium]
ALKAAEERYLALMKTATTVDDVLKVDQALRDNQSQIEQIQGRIDYLERSSAMSTITVSLMPKELDVQVGDTGWSLTTVLRSALQAFVVFLQSAATVGVWMLIFGWPILLIAIGLVFWLRSRKHTRAPGSGGQAPAEGAS